VARTSALLVCLTIVGPVGGALAATPVSEVRRAHIPEDQPAGEHRVAQQPYFNPFLDRTQEVFGTPSPDDRQPGDTTPATRQRDLGGVSDQPGEIAVRPHDPLGIGRPVEPRRDYPIGQPADASMQIELPAYAGTGTPGNNRNTGSRRTANRSPLFSRQPAREQQLDTDSRGSRYGVVDGRLRLRGPQAADDSQTTPPDASAPPRGGTATNKPSLLDRLPRLWPQRKPTDQEPAMIVPPPTATVHTRTRAAAPQTPDVPPPTVAAAPPADRASQTPEKKPLFGGLPKFRTPKWMAFGRSETNVTR